MSISSEMAAVGEQNRQSEPGPSRLSPIIRKSYLARWVGPAVTVRLQLLDASSSSWLADVSGRLAPTSTSGVASFSAIQVPAEMLLWKTVTVPRLPQEAVHAAMGLLVQTLSPFPVDDTVWSFSSKPTPVDVECDLALASRQQLDAWRQSVGVGAAGSASTELWALPEDGERTPIVLPGFGEKRRESALRVRLWVMWGLLALLLVLLVVASLSPTLQLYERAGQAQVAHLRVREQAQPALTSREALQLTTERWAALRDQLGGTLDAVRLLEVLTRLLPDDAFLSRLQVEGQKVTLTGQAGNAAALMDQLGAEPGLGAVRAPSPATKVANAAQERFVIELQVDPKVFALGAAAESPAGATSAELSRERR